MDIVVKKAEVTPLGECPVGLVKFNEQLFLKTNLHAFDLGIMVVGVGSGDAFSVTPEELVAPVKIKAYGVAEAPVNIVECPIGFFEYDGIIWLKTSARKGEDYITAVKISDGERGQFHISAPVKPVQVFEYE